MRSNLLPGVRISALLLLTAVSALAVLPVDEADATSFDPQLTSSLANSEPGAVSDVVLNFSIAAPDANFEAIVSFLPPEMGIALDADIPDGARAAELTAIATLGLLNGGCNIGVPVTFNLVDATTDTSRAYPLYAGWDDYDGDGLPENVTRYPDFLTRLAPGITPRQRLYGQQLVSGAQVFLNFVVFEPGTALARLPSFDPALGYIVVVYLDDPTAVPRTSLITDFCTPLGTSTTTFGLTQDNPATTANEAGHELRRNPANPGTYNASAFVRSRWDADNDGVENQLDPCPLTPDPTWNPRNDTTISDADYDGVPDSCDPDDDDPNPDIDDDFLSNRWDNCPLLPNQYPVDSDNDGIGDVCDPFPLDGSNDGAAHRHEVCLVSTLVVGSGGPVAPPADCPSGPDVVLPPVLEVYPESALLPVGTVNEIAVNIYDPLSFSPLPAVAVQFAVTGANETAGACLTNNDGFCEFNYLGANLGADTIAVTADVTGQPLMQTVTAEWLLPPENDDLENATPIESLPYQGTGHIVAAGTELAEPGYCMEGPRTIWYDFTPSGDTFLVGEASSESAYWSIGLYQGGSVSGLQRLACSHQIYPAGPARSLGFPPVPEAYIWAHLQGGVTYHIQISGGYGPAGGGEVALEFWEGAAGDTNCDGAATGADVLDLMRHIIGSKQTTCYEAGDMDCDHYLSPADIHPLLEWVAGLADSEPAICPPLF